MSITYSEGSKKKSQHMYVCVRACVCMCVRACVCMCVEKESECVRKKKQVW